jgi:hypothetical protein
MAFPATQGESGDLVIGWSGDRSASCEFSSGCEELLMATIDLWVADYFWSAGGVNVCSLKIAYGQPLPMTGWNR